MEQIGINVTIEEINIILESLGQRPYVEVFQLIGKIKAQAEAQIQANNQRQQLVSDTTSNSE